MARRNNSIIGALVAVGGIGLLQSGAFDGMLGVAVDNGYMSSSNPWSKDYDPEAAPASILPVYFKNCDAARAAGAAPVRAGDPGYAPHLDRDGDGVGCEPYYGR